MTGDDVPRLREWHVRKTNTRTHDAPKDPSTRAMDKASVSAARIAMARKPPSQASATALNGGCGGSAAPSPLHFRRSDMTLSAQEWLIGICRGLFQPARSCNILAATWRHRGSRCGSRATKSRSLLLETSRLFGSTGGRCRRCTSVLPFPRGGLPGQSGIHRGSDGLRNSIRGFHAPLLRSAVCADSDVPDTCGVMP